MIAHCIHPTKGIAVFLAEGRVTPRDVEHELDWLISLEDLPKRRLWDLRQADPGRVGLGAMRELGKRGNSIGFERAAFVVEKGFAYGMAKQAEGLTGFSRPGSERRLFDSLDEAGEWLTGVASSDNRRL